MHKCPDCKYEVPQLFHPLGEAKYKAVCSDCQIESERRLASIKKWLRGVTMNKQTPQQRQYERRKGQPKITGLYISQEEKALLDAAVAISGGIKAAIFDGLRLVVESQQKSATWISVNDKLPDNNSLIIAIYKYDFGCEPDAAVCRFLNGGFTPYTDGLSAKNYDGDAAIKLDMQVTHWMPLPPQPEKSK